MDRETSTKVFRLDLMLSILGEWMIQYFLSVVSLMGALASFIVYLYLGHQVYSCFFELQFRKSQRLALNCYPSSFEILAGYCAADLPLGCCRLAPWCWLRLCLGLCCLWGCVVWPAEVCSCPTLDSLAS